ncbi:hypothetical protein Poli38472_010125 [Pythium oligandrum]|uniref:Uncharacterized protein n=1 Tax=Pythium oligandrum TaxID=41045 RepID=A0A8K1C8D8_PYTOL|nr:hypothetical protein Poli38472_010125 [Pythium oligandrum]|eukprot:TMW58566.1 hypothetical protein Poli38472_010125 [Pythium oligandrum]
MAARSGNLELVKLCVEKLDTSLLTTRQRESCSKTIAQNAAAGGNVHVLEYLHTSRQERMFFAVDYSSISLEWMFEQDPSDEALLWVIRHSSEEQQAEELRFLKFCMLLNQPPATSAPSWFFVQQLMLLRPTFCRAFDQLPRWAIQRGTMSDLQTLEAIQLPALFIKSALSCLLKHSRDDALLSWFITRCDSTLLDVRVVSWAAKYDAVELLPTMVDKLTSQGEELLRIFGTVVWSAVKHEHVRVLDWVNHKTE